MPSSIPYTHPSLVLGNIVNPDMLRRLRKISSLNDHIDAAQNRMNAFITMKRSLEMTVSELLNMNVDVSAITAKIAAIDKQIAAAAANYITVRLDNESAIQTLQEQIDEGQTDLALQSPVDFARSAIIKLPLAADSLHLDAQYFSYAENQETNPLGVVAEIEDYLKAATAGLGTKAATNVSGRAVTQINLQRRNHQLSGTLIITATCTHKQARLFSPCILDPDRAVAIWNTCYPNDPIDPNKSTTSSGTPTSSANPTSGTPPSSAHTHTAAAPSSATPSSRIQPSSVNPTSGTPSTSAHSNSGTPPTSDTPNSSAHPNSSDPASNSSTSNTLSLLSGATFGSCFIGMVHILKNEATGNNTALDTLANSLQDRFRIGNWVQEASGGFGVDASIAEDIKSLLSTQTITTHVNLVTMGAIPSIRSNQLQIGVRSFRDVDPHRITTDLAALENLTATDKATIDRSAATAKTGARVMAMQGATIRTIMLGLGTIDHGANKTMDINTLMNAFEDYIKEIKDGEASIPINFYVTTLSKTQLQNLTQPEPPASNPDSSSSKSNPPSPTPDTPTSNPDPPSSPPSISSSTPDTQTSTPNISTSTSDTPTPDTPTSNPDSSSSTPDTPDVN